MSTDDRSQPGSGPRDPSAERRRIVRASAVVGIGTMLSRVSGFLRVAAIAYALGASTLAGVYSYSNETPNIVYELLLGGVLTATLVPLFVTRLDQGDRRATSAVITASVIALAIITAVGMLLAPVIVHLYTLRVSGPGRDHQRALAVDFLRLFMPQMFFYGVTALFSALLNARRKFAAAAFAPILNNVVVIAIFLSLPRIAHGHLTVDRVLHDRALVLLLGLGTTAGIAVMALALVGAVRGLGIRWAPRGAFRHAAVRAMIRLSGWTVGYVITNQIALWVVLVLANGTSAGAFVYLSAYAFFQLPHGLFAVSIMTTVQPELASAYGNDSPPALRHRFSRGLRLVLVLMIPAAAVYVGLSRPIVVALLQRGAFSSHGSEIVAKTLLAFAVGLPGFSAYLYTLRAFYAMRDTRTPFVLNCIENAINVGLALALYPSLGIPGLAWAFSGAYTVAAVLSLAYAGPRLGGLRGRGVGSAVVRVTLIGTAIAGATWGVAHEIGWSTGARAFATVGAGTLVAVVIAVTGYTVLRVEEWHELRAGFRRHDRSAAPATTR